MTKQSIRKGTWYIGGRKGQQTGGFFSLAVSLARQYFQSCIKKIIGG